MPAYVVIVHYIRSHIARIIIRICLCPLILFIDIATYRPAHCNVTLEFCGADGFEKENFETSRNNFVCYVRMYMHA